VHLRDSVLGNDAHNIGSCAPHGGKLLTHDVVQQNLLRRFLRLFEGATRREARHCADLAFNQFTTDV
jgi:hypothetical protein